MNEYIRLSGVSFCYPETRFKIRDVSLALHGGQIAVITGKNGSGKTTLGKLMMGILKAQQGDIFVKGQNLKEYSLAQTAKSVGYLFQNPERQLFCISAKEEIMFSLRQTGIDEKTAQQKTQEFLQKFSLEDKAMDFPLKLSVGEKQRLALLSIFALEPGFYILDEPTRGIDSENIQKLFVILNRLKRKGAGLCLITHSTYLAESLADRIIIMENGKVIKDEKA